MQCNNVTVRSSVLVQCPAGNVPHAPTGLKITCSGGDIQFQRHGLSEISERRFWMFSSRWDARSPLATQNWTAETEDPAIHRSIEVASDAQDGRVLREPFWSSITERLGARIQDLKASQSQKQAPTGNGTTQVRNR